MMNENYFRFSDPPISENDKKDIDKSIVNTLMIILTKLLVALATVFLFGLVSLFTSCSTTKRITDVTSDSVKIETTHHSDVKDSSATVSQRKDSSVQQTKQLSTDSTLHRIQDSIITMLIVDQNGKIIGKEVSRSHYDSRDHYKNTVNENMNRQTIDNNTTVVTNHQANTKDSSDSSAVHHQSHEQIATVPELSFFASLKAKFRIIGIISTVAFILGIIVAIKYRSFLSKVCKAVVTFIRKIINPTL